MKFDVGDRVLLRRTATTAPEMDLFHAMWGEGEVIEASVIAHSEAYRVRFGTRVAGYFSSEELLEITA